jgi:hypothetical protein
MVVLINVNVGKFQLATANLVSFATLPLLVKKAWPVLPA